MKKALFILVACLTMACNTCMAQTKHKTYTTQDTYGSWLIIGLWDKGYYVPTLGATKNAMGLMFRGNTCCTTMGDDTTCYDIKISNGNLVKAYLEGDTTPKFTFKILSLKRGEEIIGLLTFLDDPKPIKVKLASFYTE